MAERTIKIGGASGYWGDSAHATGQLLAGAKLDYLVYDYLAEITMSILARAKAKNPDMGYAADFITAAMLPNITEIAEQGVKVISNAGGLNPKACAAALQVILDKYGLDLKIAVVEGDDLLARTEEIIGSEITDMFSGAACPTPDKILSINAYLGAFPIAAALDAGADIVITGRCVDSAVTLGACIHEFGWANDDWDKLAGGSLAGHLLECGVQATGGNFTDWQAIDDMSNLGYPIAEISTDGHCIISKPENTSGLVSAATVGEQMLYEIGDPQAYILPDVVCDFSEVSLFQIDLDKVLVRGAKGCSAPSTYKTCMTYLDGFRAGNYVTFYGAHAARKARDFHTGVLKCSREILRSLNLADFNETSIEILGTGSQFRETQKDATEVVLKTAVKHEDIRGAGIFLKQLAGLGLAAAPGISGFTGVRAKPSPVVRLFSYLTDKSDVDVRVEVGGKAASFIMPVLCDKNRIEPEKAQHDAHFQALPSYPTPTMNSALGGLKTKKKDEMTLVPLVKLAWARSGDKGDLVNIGVLSRRDDCRIYIWDALSKENIAKTFAHFMTKDSVVKRYYLPGTHAMNITISNVLGGGGMASLRNDSQGKGYGQILLGAQISIPKSIFEEL